MRWDKWVVEGELIEDSPETKLLAKVLKGRKKRNGGKGGGDVKEEVGGDKNSAVGS